MAFRLETVVVVCSASKCRILGMEDHGGWEEETQGFGGGL